MVMGPLLADGEWKPLLMQVGLTVEARLLMRTLLLRTVFE
jgi:hypothetical protein